MPESAKKKLKLIKLAKELQLTVNHVRESLEKMGFEPPKSPNAAISEEMYEAALRAHAPDLYEQWRDEREQPGQREQEAADPRRKQVDAILQSEEPREGDDYLPSSVERLRKLRVIQDAEEEEQALETDESIAAEPELEAEDETPEEPEVEAEAASAESTVETEEQPAAEVPAAEEATAQTEAEIEVETPPVAEPETVAEAESVTHAEDVSQPDPAEEPKEEHPVPVTQDKVEAPAKKKSKSKSKAKAEEAPATDAADKASEKQAEQPSAAEEPTTTSTGRAVVTHEDKDSEKIDLPVFRPGRVLGMQKDPEPEPDRKRRGKKDKDKDKDKDKGKEKGREATAEKGARDAGSSERDPAASAMKTEDGRGRKRSSKRTKSEEERLARIEQNRDKQSSAGGSKRRKKKGKVKISEEEIKAAVRETTRAMEGRKKRKHRKLKGVGEANEDTNVLRLTEYLTTNELAELLDLPVADLIKKCFLMGTMITINQRLEREMIELLCDDYGYEVEFLSEFDEEEEVEEVVDEALLEPRHPVVTVMGHVDHGKTSVLDYLRRTNVVAGEAGGITQHIGAYEVVHKDQRITFLDTPGHHSFTAMRARGAQATDVVVLVVAADDRVQEQTKEAIDHALAAKVPIIVAVNKIDKPNADPQRIRKELANYNILVEDWGGKYQCVDVSAKQGTNMDGLLEEILICAEMLELKAQPTGDARGVVIEAQLDKGRGAVTTVLIQRGTLKKGDAVTAGTATGRVRMMVDERGRERLEAPPSTPVQLLGLDSVPQAGDTMMAYTQEREARNVALRRRQIQREQNQQNLSRFTTLADLSSRIAQGEIQELPVLIKGDVDGSIGAIADELMKMQTKEVRVNVIHRSVGNITENDVLLAKAANAIIIGFHVHPTPNARELAQRERVDVRLYRIIYEVVEEIHAALEGLLRPDFEEEVLGTAEVRQVFRINRKAIAGCMVVSGKIERGAKARLVRENEVVWEGGMSSLKRFKDDTKEVAQGFECGIQLDGFNDLREGDLINAFTMKEILRRLDLGAEG